MPEGRDFRYAALKARQREIRAGFPQDFALRIHRMISWIGRAEREADDPAAAFIFLWIGFNAGYSDGADLDGEKLSERDRFRDFFGRLLDCDADHLLYRAVWKEEARPIRTFIDNRYVFAPFWTFHHGRGAPDWEARFEAAQVAFDAALHDGDTAVVLSFLFDRLYMLRNQLMHGGATWGSSVNRAQLDSGATLLGALLPVVADIMMTEPRDLWGRPFFPVVEETP